MKELNPKQKLFCEYYCGEYFGNAYQAAIAAGYSPKYAKNAAQQIVENSGVKKYIGELRHKETKKRIATVDDIKAFFTDIMNDTEQATKDRIRAAELLAKTAGAFRDDW